MVPLQSAALVNDPSTIELDRAKTLVGNPNDEDAEMQSGKPVHSQAWKWILLSVFCLGVFIDGMPCERQC